MLELKEYKYIILITLLVLAFGFYWYSWRPTKIRKSCLVIAKSLASYVVEQESKMELNGITITKRADYNEVRDNKYKECKIENGLEK